MLNSLLIKNGNVLVDGQLKFADIYIREGIIAELKENIAIEEEIPIYDAKGALVLPGFIDIHTHGGCGVDLNNAGVEDIQRLCKFFASCGTTSFLPTLLTDTKEKLQEGIKNIVKAMKSGSQGSSILGIHLEGPYLCSEYKGAMPEHLLQKPFVEDFQFYQHTAEDNILLMTVSPEVEGMAEFIKEISRTGVIISLGHSGADYETTVRCIENGAKSCTHIFNAMKLMHQHFPAVSGAVLESDIYCEAICDGMHLHPAVVRILLKTKGINRVIGVTDSIMAAGLGDGKYKLGVNDIVVVDGDARLADLSARAGSTLTTNKGFKNLIKFTGRPIEEISKILSENPADLLGISDRKGTLKEGKDADLVILDSKYDVISTFVSGKRVF
jgi:N-acetylglucosamine-6-phosphate deacetylase